MVNHASVLQLRRTSGSRRARGGAAVLTASLAALAAAPVAHAATYCVADPACVSAGGSAKPTLAFALLTASNTPAADTVKIGPGTFKGNFTTGGPNSPIEIVGAGRNKTTLVAEKTGAPNYDRVLSLQGNATNPASVRDLTVSLSGKDPRGIELHGASALRVNVVGGSAIGGMGVIETPGTYEGGSVLMSADDNIGVAMDIGGSVVRDSAITAAIGVRAWSSTAGNTVARTSITTTHWGVWHQAGTLRLDDSLLDGRGAQGGKLVQVSHVNPGDAQLSLEAHGDTFVGKSADTSARAIAVAATEDTDHPTAVVADSVVTGFPTTARVSASAGTASLTYDHTVHAETEIAKSGMGDTALVDTAFPGDPVDPGFVNAAVGNFHLRSDSPLVDAGTPGPLDPSAGTTDLDGQPRLTDGDGDGVAARDLGAYERAGVPAPPTPMPTGSVPQDEPAVPGPLPTPAPAAPATPAPAPRSDDHPSDGPAVTPVDRVAPRLAAVSTARVKARRRTASAPAAPAHTELRAQLDEAATLTVSAQRRTGKRWTTVKGALVLRGAVGANAWTWPATFAGRRLPAGTYRLSIVARDAAGNVAAPVTTTITVKAAK